MSSTTAGRKGFTYLEIAIACMLAAVIATVAVAVYNWAVVDTTVKLVRNDAAEFERNVRAVANTELRAPTTADGEAVAAEMTVDEKALTITTTPNGFEIERNGRTACVVLGEELNAKGTITDGNCS